MTPTDSLSDFGTGLATNSDSVDVSLGATDDSTPIPTVLRTHLFFVAWLPRRILVDLEIQLSWVTKPGAVTRWYSAANEPYMIGRIGRAAALTRRLLCTPHTNKLRCMVAIADRSPARYIFELKLAEVPSGPLNSKLMMFRPRTVTYRGRSRGRRSRFPTTTVVAF